MICLSLHIDKINKNKINFYNNQCLHYISQRNDVKGVFLEHPIYMTNGYTILLKYVPMFGLSIYILIGHSSRLNLKSVYNQNISLSSFAYISDYVSLYNTPYLLKQLFSKPEYNYLAQQVDRQFVETGYNEVFRAGSAKFMKRHTTDESEAGLFQMASKTPLGQNQSILEYEGYWLLQDCTRKVAACESPGHFKNWSVSVADSFISLFQTNRLGTECFGFLLSKT